jgi:preprotein translocase SecE subunit
MTAKLFTPIIAYFRGVVEESKKITFPTKNQTINNSIIVIISIIVGTALLALLDYLVVNLWEKIII